MVGSCKLPPPSVIPVSEASPEATCPIHIPAMVDGMRRPSAPRFFSSSAQPTTTTVYFSPAPEVPYPLGMKLDSPRISIGMDMQITATPPPSAVVPPSTSLLRQAVVLIHLTSSRTSRCQAHALPPSASSRGAPFVIRQPFPSSPLPLRS